MDVKVCKSVYADVKESKKEISESQLPQAYPLQSSIVALNRLPDIFL